MKSNLYKLNLISDLERLNKNINVLKELKNQKKDKNAYRKYYYDFY